MRRDILIDNNVTKNFGNPLDSEYKKLVAWLIRHNADHPLNDAYLAVSNKLLCEYSRTSGYSQSLTNITVIVDILTREGRLNKISNSLIKKFKSKFFRKYVVQRLTCNPSDWDHISVVMLSDRKYALSLDANFRSDVNNFPGFSALAAKRPQDIPYSS